MTLIAPDFTTITDVIVARMNSELAANLPAAGELNSQVLDYPPLAYEGNSPVLSVHDDGAERIDATFLRWRVHYRLTIAVNRELGADAAEENLRLWRRLALEALMTMVPGVAGAFDTLQLNGKTQPALDVVDGIAYRLEEVLFYVEINCPAAALSNELLVEDDVTLAYGDELPQVVSYSGD